MKIHEVARMLGVDPSLPSPRCPPPIDDVRPPRCPHCGSTARSNGRVVIEGNGVRERPVVVAQLQGDRVRLVRDVCWSRRFLCRACSTSTLVLPRGVVHGSLYSLPAVLWVWLHVHPLLKAVVGSGEVCTPPGADRAERLPGRRWRLGYVWSRRLGRLASASGGGPRGWLQRILNIALDLASRAASWVPTKLLQAIGTAQPHRGSLLDGLSPGSTHHGRSNRPHRRTRGRAQRRDPMRGSDRGADRGGGAAPLSLIAVPRSAP